jgi:hypothetical protein
MTGDAGAAVLEPLYDEAGHTCARIPRDIGGRQRAMQRVRYGAGIRVDFQVANAHLPVWSVVATRKD